jgi:CelD/BcsL family acetyltransferase involved in cellulose biosynthesis
VPSNQRIQIKPWTDQDFASARPQWQELLGRCDADPLFMSWDWQWLWWQHYGPELDGELFLLAGYSTDGLLIGLAPLYIRRAPHRTGLNANRIESLGSALRRSSGVFSEYLDILVARDHEEAFIAVLADAILHETRWSDLVVSNTKHDGIAARLMRGLLSASCYVREIDSIAAHVVSLPTDFADYVRALKSGTRRKLWNHRARLSRPRIVLGEAQDIPSLFNLMNSLHIDRWGALTFTGLRMRFHQALAHAFAQRNQLRFSLLMVDDNPISVAYNVRIGDTEYSIQSGFKPHAIRGISPGYLHFGYCIEQACLDGLRKFDFLAGPGRHRDYKREFLTSPTPLATFQAIRSRPLGWLYRTYDRRFHK